MSKKLIMIIAVVLVVLSIGATSLVIKNKDAQQTNTSTISQNSVPEGNALVNAVFEKVKAETPTVIETRAVTEDTDENNLIGKEGEYQYAGNFYDTRTGYKPTNDSGEELDIKDDNYGTTAGGSIEIFASNAYAEKRGEYLAQFQTGIINAGAYRVVDTVVLRVSENYKASEQKQMLDLMQSAL